MAFLAGVEAVLEAPAPGATCSMTNRTVCCRELLPRLLRGLEDFLPRSLEEALYLVVVRERLRVAISLSFFLLGFFIVVTIF